MKREKFQVLSTVLCVACLTLVLACAGPTPTTTQESGKDTLVIAVSELPPNIDNELCPGPVSHYFIENTAEQLIEYGSKPSSISEGIHVVDYEATDLRLAESFELSPDSRTMTFHLRKGVKSPWGNEFTTEDVLWKWERGFGMQSLGTYFASVMDLSGIEAIKAIDDYTVSVTASNPNALLRHLHCLVCIGFYDSTEAMKHATSDDPWAQDYIGKFAPGFGPYYVTEWTAGQQAVLTANPNYYRGEPEIKKVIFKVVPESSSRVAMLKDGTIDVALELSPREIVSLRDAPGVMTIEERGIWLIHLVMNEDLVEPFGNKLVRQAINYAIDRDRIIDTAYFGLAEPMKGVLQMQYPGVLNPEEFPYEYNPDKAKQLMTEAGYPNGFEVELSYRAGTTQQESTAVLVQENLAEIGIDASLKKVPSGTFEVTVRASECPFAVYLDASLIPDVNYSCALFYRSDGFCNFGNFYSSVVDDMLSEGNLIVDNEERIEYHYDLQRVLLEEAPVGFICQEKYIVGIRDNVKGWNIPVGEDVRLEDLRFAK